MTGYLGSKAASGLYQNIIAIMPPHSTYIETHLGEGAIMLKKPPAAKNIAVEINQEVLDSFECDHPVEKVNGCAHKFLRNYQFNSDELVFADPPYV